MKTTWFISLPLLFIGGLGFSQESSVRLDAAFAHNGYAMFPVNGGMPSAIDWQSDGKMIWAGEMANNQVFIGRFKTDGTIDSSFGTSGFYYLAMGSYSRCIKGLKVWEDNSISCVFTYGKQGGAGLVNVRLNANGMPDVSFGNQGISEAAFSNLVNLPKLTTVFLPDRSQVIGTSVYTTSSNGAVVRIKPDGTPDLTFGNGGMLLFDSLNTFDGVSALKQAPDGDFVAAGVRQSGQDGQWALYKFGVQGDLKSDFGGDGLVSYSVPNHDGYKTSPMGPGMEFANEGKLLLTGITSYGQFYDVAYRQLLSNGSPDLLFGENGFITNSAPFNINGFRYPIPLDDGRILNIGQVSDSPYPLWINAMFTNGAIDSTVHYRAEAIQVTNYGVYAWNYRSGEQITLGGVCVLADKQYMYVLFSAHGEGSPTCGVARLVIDALPAGLQDAEALGSYSMHPNPSNEFIFLNSGSDFNSDVFQVYSMNGKRCKIQFESIGNGHHSADVRSLSNGLYFLVNTCEGHALKFIIDR